MNVQRSFLCITVIFTLITMVQLQHTVPGSPPDPNFIKMFEEWKLKYGKKYKSPGEERVRQMIFGMNLMKIDSHNNNPENTFQMAINYFADMTQGEFGKILGTRNTSHRGLLTLKEDEEIGRNLIGGVGDGIDYENDPCIGPVEHQQTCGSCYAFSAAHVAAWHYCKKQNGGRYVNFSKQQIVDCSYRDMGCTSGWTSTAINYMAKHGILAEEDYPYVSEKNKCSGKKLKSGKLYFPIMGTMKIDKNEEAMKNALAEHGPLLVIIDALKLAFYSSGIITGSTCEHGTVNHAVVLVALKTGSGKGYWRVKNHWGADWGENGYFNLEAFYPVDQGCLGIAGFPSYAY